MKIQNNGLVLRHLSLSTSDGLLLPGLHYSNPSMSSTKKLLIYVHGAGSSSILRWPKLTNTLADKLTSASVDMLTFNNRGAGYITKFDTTKGKSVTGGMSYENISECELDIDSALKWAKQNNYNEIYLYGHSTGANKLVLWANIHKSNKNVKGLILSAGGDDVSLQLSRYNPTLLGRLEKFMKNSTPKQIVPIELFPGDHPISVGSLKELITQNSNYDVFPFRRPDEKNAFKLFKAVEYPLSIIYGSDDFGTIIPTEEAVKVLRSLKPCKAKIIPNADHSYNNRETDLAAAVLECVLSK